MRLREKLSAACMPGDIASWLHALGIDVAISIILSAYGFRNTTGLILRKRDP